MCTYKSANNIILRYTNALSLSRNSKRCINFLCPLMDLVWWAKGQVLLRVHIGQVSQNPQILLLGMTRGERERGAQRKRRKEEDPRSKSRQLSIGREKRKKERRPLWGGGRGGSKRASLRANSKRGGLCNFVSFFLLLSYVHERQKIPLGKGALPPTCYCVLYCIVCTLRYVYIPPT